MGILHAFLPLIGLFIYSVKINDTTSRRYSYSSGSRGSSYSGGHSSGGNILAGDTGGPGFAVQGTNYGDSISTSHTGYSSQIYTLYCYDTRFGYNLEGSVECSGYYDSRNLHPHYITSNGSISVEYCYPPY